MSEPEINSDVPKATPSTAQIEKVVSMVIEDTQQKSGEVVDTSASKASLHTKQSVSIVESKVLSHDKKSKSKKSVHEAKSKEVLHETKSKGKLKESKQPKETLPISESKEGEPRMESRKSKSDSKEAVLQTTSTEKVDVSKSKEALVVSKSKEELTSTTSAMEVKVKHEESEQAVMPEEKSKEALSSPVLPQAKSEDEASASQLSMREIPSQEIVGDVVSKQASSLMFDEKLDEQSPSKMKLKSKSGVHIDVDTEPSIGPSSSGVRRRSSLRQRYIGSVIAVRKQSTLDTGVGFKFQRYMNSYKLWSDNPFNPEKVETVLKVALEDAMQNLTSYNASCAIIARKTSAIIRSRVRELDFDRYKLICLVTIGEKHSQSMRIVARFLWDVARDRYAIYSVDKTYIFATALCFGIYYE